jgi:hypothetical protein
MPDIIITVQGEHSAWYPAERATVFADVQVDGPKRDGVFASAVSSSEALRTSIEAQFDRDAGPITWWTSDSVRVWSDRPWNNEGKTLPLVYHAAVSFSAKFSDFDALARWVEAAAGVEHVTVSSISWDLTDSTRASVTTEVRTLAVQDAVAKATVLAQAIGASTVTAVALADPGMLGDQSGAPAPAPMFRAMASPQGFDGGGAPVLAFKPEEIAVASVVDARFIAS